MEQHHRRMKNEIIVYVFPVNIVQWTLIINHRIAPQAQKKTTDQNEINANKSD